MEIEDEDVPAPWHGRRRNKKDNKDKIGGIEIKHNRIHYHVCTSNNKPILRGPHRTEHILDTGMIVSSTRNEEGGERDNRKRIDKMREDKVITFM